MEYWQQQLKDSITSPQQLAERFPVDVQALEKVVERYPMRITPYYLSLIEQIDDPIWRQCIPDFREIQPDDSSEDPLNEENLSPVPAIVHRYPDRVLFLVSGACATYCRFCTRKRKVGCAAMKTSFGDVLSGIDYIARTPSVRDVILSGGDPLLMSDALLRDVFSRLRSIRHVEIIRLGTRLPVTLPERITENLCAILREFNPLYVMTHFNHPREITPESSQACMRLADAGIPVSNQTVLLKGVNDDPTIMADLMKGLLKIRVRPYYLHHMDLTLGTRHFRTSVKKGIEIMSALRGPVSGLANPYYVIDAPGGKGKVPILPDYLEKAGDDIVLHAPGGERIVFPDDIREAD